MKAWVDNSAEALDWAGGVLASHGVGIAPMPIEMQVIPDAWYEHFATDAFQIVPTEELIAEGSEAGYEPPFAIGWAKAFTAYASELGVDVRFNCEAKQLVKSEEGAVTGVVYSGETGFVQVNAESVVLATGGYGADEEMLDAFVPHHAEDIHNITTPAHNTGDGIRMGAWRAVPWSSACCPMYFDEGVEHLSTLHSPDKAALVVSQRHGRAFCNEDMPMCAVLTMLSRVI
ncbi:MAG: FAD-binding protein [Eggerthellaceae bacterium]